MSNRDERDLFFYASSRSTSAEAMETADHTSDAASSPRGVPRFVSIASSSPLDTPTVSGEDDDYRSETSSETTHHHHHYSSSFSSSGTGGDTLDTGGSGGGLKRPRKQVASGYSNHRDLSLRLKRAVHNAAENANFDESLIGADVVLCVTSSATRYSEKSQKESESAQQTQSTPPPTAPPSVKKFHAHRFMLAASSEPFRAMLTGRMREASQREVEIYDVVLDLENVVGLLIAAEMYELAALREICKSFVLYHAHEVFRNPQIVELPEKLLLEIIEHNELQIRELPLLEALVSWGQARVENSDKTPVLDILSDVMEHVRFGTMSVSDLYGKVRPLVRDGVIRESLLTEALFFHLKWGTPSGRASQRMKPRALAAALRKRKRVSFIQHVSFTDE